LAGAEDSAEEAIAFARTFSCYSLVALRHARAAVQRSLALPLDEGLRIEADLSTLAFQSRDAQEGMTAFSEKRLPNFVDA